jgi:hypothetical protein
MPRPPNYFGPISDWPIVPTGSHGANPLAVWRLLCHGTAAAGPIWTCRLLATRKRAQSLVLLPSIGYK